MSKPIRFYAIGDIHISERHINITKEALDNCVKLVEKCTADIDMVVVMGDVLDNHNNVKLHHLHMAMTFFRKLSKVKKTLVLIGNHDRVNNKDWMSDIHPFMGMESKDDKNLYIINKPKILRFHKSSYALFMPYVPPGRFEEAINLYLKQMGDKLSGIKSIKDISIIFAHQEFKGSQYGPIVSTKGDAWPLDYPMVVSGHIHGLCQLQKNIFYTGSLYPITVSEGNDKGVIRGTYYPETKVWEYKVTRVVSSQKKVIWIDAKDEDAVSEMINLDRPHTKYVIQGTQEELNVVRSKAKSKGLNITWDARPKQIDTKCPSFDTVLGQLVQEDDVKKLLERILS